MSKPIPPATVEFVFPPNLNYQYFENHQDHPFRYTSEKFQMVNAWWLAESSLLAYAESDFAQESFSAAGLKTKLFDGKSTQCYVAHNDNFVIVAFRGTQIYKPGSQQNFLDLLRDTINDIYIDIKFHLVDSAQGGFVHQGFKEGLDEIWHNLVQYLNQLKKENPSRTLWFTGHSLGAALATLAADRYESVRGLYTFGSPLVGDKAFNENFKVNTYRFVNNNDFITRIPLAGNYKNQKLQIGKYHHVGQLKYISRDGHILDNPNFWDRLIDGFQGNFENLFNSLGGLREGWTGEIPADNLTDHAPIFYTINIWNNYEKDLNPRRE